MAHYAIHVPLEKDKRFYKKYKEKGLSDNDAAYAGLIEGMDKSLGDLMDYLEKNDLMDNTIILLCRIMEDWRRSLTGTRLCMYKMLRSVVEKDRPMKGESANR